MPPPAHRSWGYIRTRATIALTTVLFATLAACSSSSDDKTGTTSSSPTTAAETPTTAPTAPDAIELERVADTHVNLYFGGACEGGGYAFLSKRCRAKADPATYAATVGQAAKDYGPDHPATDVHATVSGAMGRISYKVKGLPNFDQQGQPWTVEGGAWKYDAC